MQRAYAILWGQCTQYMKSTFESINEFEKPKLNRDPMKLHQLICKFAFNYEDHLHLPDTLHSVIPLLYSLRQINKMSDQKYYRRFKAHYEGIRMAGGHIGQHSALIKMYKDDGQSDKDAANSAEDPMAAVMFLKGANPTRHGELLKDLHNQHTRRLGKYCKDSISVYELIQSRTMFKTKGRLVLPWRMKESLSS